MDNFEKLEQDFTVGLINHVNAITINAYLHGIFGETTDEDGIPLEGLDNTRGTLESLRRFLSDCIGTDAWYIKKKTFIVTSKRYENYVETIEIPMIVSINKDQEPPDNIEIEI